MGKERWEEGWKGGWTDGRKGEKKEQTTDPRHWYYIRPQLCRASEDLLSELLIEIVQVLN